jgi:hypothetical protein
MVAPAYAERRSGLAKQFGLGRAGRKAAASTEHGDHYTAEATTKATQPVSVMSYARLALMSRPLDLHSVSGR